MSEEHGVRYGVTESGRKVVICECGGGDKHPWEPNGGGARILACPSDWPLYVTPKTSNQESKP